MPLAMLAEGEMGIVSEIHGGRGLRKRLAEMGFNVGEIVTMCKNHNPGPVMVEIMESRLGIGRGVAMKILVEVLS
jgi:Fe2+ transport system protein FeoA